MSWPVLVGVAVAAALAPLVFTDFFVSVILTKSLWLGLAAASLIFLSAYGGMVSLGQVGIYGIAGMAYANLVAADGGSAAEWAPWLATGAAILIAVAVALAFGAIAARSVGIYFLMITLAFSVLVYYFFSQVTQLSGFGGVNNVDLPALVGEPGQDPTRLYYTTLVVALAVFVGLRYVSRTPFGLALQGLRDEPARMGALGFNVTRHRILAFGLAAVIAAVAGVLSVWYNRRITPGSINLAQTIDVLIIAVIGGLYRLEGAWVGALTYALLDNYSREWTPTVGNVLGPERFNTILGVVFLVIVLLSPGGLVGEPGQDPTRLYYTTLVVALVVFVGLRYVSRTPFGLALQGLRDEPSRMRALGFNVTRHRILAFSLAAFVAAIAGILSVWYNRRITPGSIELAQTIDVLIIAVIGGLYRLEGAWVGALTYALLDNYSREWTPTVGDVLGPERFNTILGVVFLVIVLLSPGGLVGLWERGREFLERRRRGPPGAVATPSPAGAAGDGTN